MNPQQLLKRIRVFIAIFIVGLVISGITAFPIETQLAFGANHPELVPDFMQDFLNNVYEGIKHTNAHYPWIAYGTDWLAFAHLVIAVVFIGPYRDPVRNIWVIQFGMIACAMVIPLALIAGPVRDIPFYWRLVDCSFGAFGVLPLWYVYNLIKRLEQAIEQVNT